MGAFPIDVSPETVNRIGTIHFSAHPTGSRVRLYSNGRQGAIVPAGR